MHDKTIFRTTITLDHEAYMYLEQAVKSNRSAFINTLIKAEKQRQLKAAIIQANKEEAEDAAYESDLSDWDITLSDGLE